MKAFIFFLILLCYFWNQWFLEFPINGVVIGIKSVVTRARLIKPAAMEILMPFPAQIHAVML